MLLSKVAVTSHRGVNLEFVERMRNTTSGFCKLAVSMFLGTIRQSNFINISDRAISTLRPLARKFIWLQVGM